MSFDKDNYLKRIVDERVNEYMQLFGAILIEGPKWCGKTWTSLYHSKSVVYLLDPTGDYSNKKLALLNPSLILSGEFPRVIDEWQEVPGIWDAVRHNVDQTPGYGQYILTGSATPPKESYSHSGAGRIATIRMRPMTLFESSDSSGSISLIDIINRKRFDPFIAEINLLHLINITIRGGWPETLNLPLLKAGKVSVEYINAIVNNELFRDDQAKKNQIKLRRLLRSLARNNTTTASIKTLTMDIDGSERQDQSVEEINISRDSVVDYIKDLKEIFVIDELPPWNPEIRSKTIMRQAVKRIFIDPSLAIAALNLNSERLLYDLNTFGFMFENLCLRDLSVYTDSYGGNLYHYHDNSDLEVDAIIEMPDGTWSAFEIKLGEDQVEEAAGTLLRMKRKMIDAKAPPPACLAVITGGGIARIRDDGIYVIPINALKN